VYVVAVVQAVAEWQLEVVDETINPKIKSVRVSRYTCQEPVSNAFAGLKPFE